jgi:site-specific recombinase XerD
LENRSKTNNQAFAEYFDLIASSKSKKWDYETRRILGQFREFIGEYPPTVELFTRFFQRYSKLALSTRARYYYVFSAFFDWYSGQKLPFKIKAPKPLPQHVPDEDVEKLLTAMRERKSHKKLVERDIVLVETFNNTGLRRSELSPNLKVGDLHLSGKTPFLLVRHGKGGKPREIPLNDYIRDRLASFTKGRDADESVFGLASKTVSMKIGYWARKAGVSIHTHSLRHKFATDILERGGNIRAVQQILGHESLATTESYLAVTDKSLRDAVNLLDKGRQKKGQAAGVPPIDKQQLPGGKEGVIEQEPYEETPHERKMRELAKALAGRISLPSPWDKDLWRDLPVEFQPGKYYLPVGAVEIGEDKQIKVNYYDIGAGIAEPHLVKGLLSHLSTSGSSKFMELVGGKGKLDDWVGAVGQYSEAVLKFLMLITDEVKGYRAKVFSHDEAKPGLAKSFIATAWKDAILKATGYSWITDSWYKPHESIPGTNLWQLRCGAYIIGIAESKKTLKTYENWHKKLRVKYAKNKLAQDIAAKYQKLNDTAQDIGQRLQEFSDMRRLPGHCELC